MYRKGVGRILTRFRLHHSTGWLIEPFSGSKNEDHAILKVSKIADNLTVSSRITVKAKATMIQWTTVQINQEYLFQVQEIASLPTVNQRPVFPTRAIVTNHDALKSAPRQPAQTRLLWM